MKTELRELIRGAWALGPAWRVWMILLLLANAVAPWFFLPKLAAVVTLVATATALPLALAIIRLQGQYTKLLGMIHAPWVPMLAALLYLFPWDGDFDAYKAWLTCSIVLSAISLAIDATDVCRFLRD